MNSDNGKKKSMIKADDIVVRFGDVTALDSFSVDIPSDVVGLLGPNGAGKTTFIKTLLGLVQPERGKIYIKGLRKTGDLRALRDMVGYMPEDECLIEAKNAFELVSFMGRISGMGPSDAVQRGHEVLDFVGIGEERYRKIDSYSTGMKQRVKLAQAIVHDPEILFLDEPTNGMDPEGKEEMLELIKKIGDTGKTIIMCSHLLHEVEQIAEHVVIINRGRLLRAGDMDEILMGKEGILKIKIRGEPDDMSAFVAELKEGYDVLNMVNEGGQLSVVLDGVESSNELFKLAEVSNIQIRSYRPHMLSLEDVFMDAFEGVKVDGD
ncbi:MAG: ABC transporter ATP-binding protein [Thermoplasmata archaeon]